MNRRLVGRASRLPLGRLAPQSVAGETPAQAAETAAPQQPTIGSWSQCMRKSDRGLSKKPSATSISAQFFSITAPDLVGRILGAHETAANEGRIR